MESFFSGLFSGFIALIAICFMGMFLFRRLSAAVESTAEPDKLVQGVEAKRPAKSRKKKTAKKKAIMSEPKASNRPVTLSEDTQHDSDGPIAEEETMDDLLLLGSLRKPLCKREAKHKTIVRPFKTKSVNSEAPQAPIPPPTPAVHAQSLPHVVQTKKISHPAKEDAVHAMENTTLQVSLASNRKLESLLKAERSERHSQSLFLQDQSQRGRHLTEKLKAAEKEIIILRESNQTLTGVIVSSQLREKSALDRATNFEQRGQMLSMQYASLKSQMDHYAMENDALKQETGNMLEEKIHDGRALAEMREIVNIKNIEFSRVELERMQLMHLLEQKNEVLRSKEESLAIAMQKIEALENTGGTNDLKIGHDAVAEYLASDEGKLFKESLIAPVKNSLLEEIKLLTTELVEVSRQLSEMENCGRMEENPANDGVIEQGHNAAAGKHSHTRSRSNGCFGKTDDSGDRIKAMIVDASLPRGEPIAPAVL